MSGARRRRPGTAWLALAALAGLAAAHAAATALAGGGTIVRQHLDAGRVQFTGMDINGDGVGDSIRVDRIKQTLVYFVGDHKSILRAFDPASLPEEDRRFVPDVLVENDLDGDEIEDLLIFNRAYLAKYADNAQTFARILAGSVYIGQPRGAFLSLAAAAPADEARERILARARELATAAP